MAPSHSFHVHASHQHLHWSNALTPALTVPSGAELTLDLPDGGGNQITRENASAGTALSSFEFARSDPCVGPIYVEGAEPGDVLRVDILEVEPSEGYGWTAVFRGFGVLCGDEEFGGEQSLKIWDLSSAATTGSLIFKPSNPRILIPYAPFLGIVGVAPSAAGEHPTVPPMPETGGNIDTKYLTAGSSLFLPVKVRGALLSCGDAHAAQGDGEVCGTAVEMRARARIRVTVEKDKGNGNGKGWVKGPWVLTAPAEKRRQQQQQSGERAKAEAGDVGEKDSREYMCLGIDPDLREATRKAVRGVIDWLEAEKGLTRVEGYMLASVAGNLKMCEVVDMPNYAIGCSIPLSIFVS
ncbi:hypothetical protein F4776DRAFT_662227 [Hypoxylon sp. NC0597]|nr:hypothetical protein F4776DRAFT_662227 [Hypoxylon sp. NC0597]